MRMEVLKQEVRKGKQEQGVCHNENMNNHKKRKKQAQGVNSE